MASAAARRADLAGAAPCRMGLLPRQLSSLGSLKMLSLWGNYLYVRLETPAPLESLQELTALTRLDISDCGLRALPEQLTTLRYLAHLNADGNYFNNTGQGLHREQQQRGRWHIWRRQPRAVLRQPAQHSPLAPLLQLAALTFLDLRRCEIRVWPQELASLPELKVRRCIFAGSSKAACGGQPQNCVYSWPSACMYIMPGYASSPFHILPHGRCQGVMLS